MTCDEFLAPTGAIAEHMRTELIADALTAARDKRGSLAGAMFHSDHGAASRRR